MNAGHNAPIIFAHGGLKLLEPTGMPLGLFSDAKYEANKLRFVQVIPFSCSRMD